jgi:hypothetical protein
VSVISFLITAWAIVVRLFTQDAIPGWASTVLPIYFLGGIQLLCLGIMGEYLAKIYSETKRRPSLHHRKSNLTMKANPVSRLPNIRTKQSLFWAGHGTTGVVAALLGLAILANVFAAYYVNQEHSVYVWDYKLYWLFYRDFGSSLVQHPMDALHSLIESIQNDDYNLLPVLPLSPFAWLFGTSRLTYILAITNVALLPSALIISLLAQRILPQQFPQTVPLTTLSVGYRKCANASFDVVSGATWVS